MPRRGHREKPGAAGGITLTLPPREEVKVLPVGWTVEHALYAVLVLIAALVRLLWLGERPLSPQEAHQAWLAWRNTQPLPAEPVVDVSPLVYTVQWVVFLITGGGDALARIGSALVGVGMVLLPYALRRHLGRSRALLSAAFLALSPQLTYWSRHAGGTVWTLALGLGLVVALLAWLEATDEEAPARLTWVALIAALLLTTTPLAYTLLIGLAVGLWPVRGRLVQGWHDVGGAVRHRAAWVFVLALLVSGSVALTNLPAFGNVADLLGAWVQRFWVAEGYPWYWVPWRLWADEPLLVVFGAWGAWRAWYRRELLARVWLAWGGVALLLGLIQLGRTSQDVALVTVPLAFLAADGVFAFIQRWRPPVFTWREEGVLIAAYFVILGFWFMMMAGYFAVGDERYIPALLAVPVVLVGLTVLYRFWLSPAAAWRVVMTTILITAAFWSWMALWVQNLHLAEDAALDALPGVERTMTHPNVRLMVQTLERISAQRATDMHELPVDLLVSGEGDVLRWYLRDFVNLREIRSIKAATAPVVITPADTPSPPGYTGMDWVLTVTLLPTDLGGRIYHWWFYRQAPLGDAVERVILWYRP